MKNMKLQEEVKGRALSDRLMLRMRFLGMDPELGAVAYDGYKKH